MGFYIETSTTHGKDEYLIRKGAIQVSLQQAREIVAENSLRTVVCVVDNGPFEAAAICVDSREFEAFARPGDMRPKVWLCMNKHDVLTISGHEAYIFE